MKNHSDYLQRAIDISIENVKLEKGGPFGAIIVKNNEIIAEGFNAVTKLHDPSAHAEIQAIRIASKKLNSENLSGCIIYSSCEPCPMCLGAIYWARLDELYFAASKNDAAKSGFDDAAIYNELNKPISHRSIPTRQISDLNHTDAFNIWIQNENKIKY